jgi:hypothetical protein
MKKIIIIGFCILTVSSLLFFGCKKGPEDPFLSFRSRKARVSGAWTVTAYTINGIDSLTHTRVDDSTDTYGAYTLTTSTTSNYTWTFDKTGSYDIQFGTATTVTRTFPKTSKGPSSTTKLPVLAPLDQKGIWDFAGGVGQFNNKEEIILTDPTDHVDDITYDMIKCSYKELILSQSITDRTTGLVTIYQWTMTRNK